MCRQQEYEDGLEPRMVVNLQPFQELPVPEIQAVQGPATENAPTQIQTWDTEISRTVDAELAAINDMVTQFRQMGPQERRDFLRTLDHCPPLQWLILGETLSFLINELDNQNVVRLTEIFLQLPQEEILDLIASPDSLAARVAEAVEAHRRSQQDNNSAGPSA